MSPRVRGIARETAGVTAHGDGAPRAGVRVARLACAAALSAVVLGAGVLRAQEVRQVPPVSAAPPVYATGTAALEAVPDVRARARLQAVVRSADQRGLPVEPLYAKIREGVAKQSAPERIAEAVTRLAGRLAESQEALASAQSIDEIAIGADALHVGASPATLRQLRGVWPARSLVVPLGVLTEMIAAGVPAPHAAARLRELMERGATNAQLVELGTRVQQDIGAGRAAGAAFEQRARGVMSLLAPKPAHSFTSPPIRPP